MSFLSTTELLMHFKPRDTVLARLSLSNRWSHIWLLSSECFAGAEEWSSWLDLCPGPVENKPKFSLLHHTVWEVVRDWYVVHGSSQNGTVLYDHFVLVCPKKEIVSEGSWCVRALLSFKSVQSWILRFRTLTWPCSDWDVYWGGFVGMSTSGKWRGKMLSIVSSWIIFLTGK